MLSKSSHLSTNPAAVYLASLAPGSRRTMQQSLNAVALLLTDGKHDAMACQWHLLKYQHLAALRSLLAEKYAPATCNKMLAAIRRVLKECERLGLMAPDERARVTDIKRVKGNTELKGRALKPSEISTINTNCSTNSTRDIRDAAILATLRVGLRRQEIVNLQVDDFLIDGWLKVRGKGGKLRNVPFRTNDLPVVTRWIQLRGNAPGLLFYPISKSGTITRRQLTPDAIRHIVQSRGKKLEHFTPHDFRRTFASDLFDSGADTSTIQQLLGHSDPATTTKYDRRGGEAKKRAVDLL